MHGDDLTPGEIAHAQAYIRRQHYADQAARTAHAPIAALVENLRSLGVFAVDFSGAFVDGLYGVRVSNREITGCVVW